MTTAIAHLPQYTATVRPEWTEGEHLSVAHFLLLFDRASDAVRDGIGLGRDYAQRNNASLVVAEAHLTYAKEVRSGDQICIFTYLLGVAPRKLHIFHEMRRHAEDAIVSTAELILVHVDRGNGRATAFAADALHAARNLAQQHEQLPRPFTAGRAIRFEASR